MVARQLALGVHLDDGHCFENFYRDNNEELLQALQHFLRTACETVFFIWGERGIGKTHLLRACGRDALSESRAVRYLDCAALTMDSAELRASVDGLSLLCIDNIEKILDQADWQESLFHCFNRLKERQGQVIVAAQSGPRHLQMQLEDLRSRLSWGAVYQLHSLDDGDKLKVLQFRAQLRGLLLSDDIATYLLNRMPRNMKDLFHVLQLLDDASMVEQRSITIPFVKQVLDGR